MDNDRAGRCTRCGILDNLDVDGNCGFCMADLFNLKRASDVPTGQIPSAKNLVCPLCHPVKAVAVDTNEECETASQAHTGTKD